MIELIDSHGQRYVRLARNILGFNQAQFALQLGWKDYRQVNNIENGHRPIQPQTYLAIECLLRRKRKWKVFLDYLAEQP
ncbi:helix-turn-helix transcriptional regulator [Vibrio vulnificus]|nr:helix-turn-helix transcriptional regulator [Vibrio vulnificus]